MNVFSLTLAALIVGFAFTAEAARDDVMPPPKSAPRIPVERQPLAGEKEYEGAAKALDGERLSINGTEIRLFGIVTPALSSNYGPKSRQQLDRMLQGTVLCKVTDKDKDGNPIAFCGTVNVPDVSYEMLRQGWAMVDRKALKGNNLSEIYGKVEQEAQAANRGIFAPTPMATVIPLTNPGKSTTVPVDTAEPTVEAAVQTFLSPSTINSASSMIDEQNSSIATPPSATPAVPEAQAAPTPAPQQIVAPASAASSVEQSFSFIERYQVLIGTIFLFLAACIYAMVPMFRERERTKENRRSVAAALRGELMAARHICRTKARELSVSRKGDVQTLRPSQLWPRIRTVVYQANVGSIGLLGSELARRVASVYAQCVEYAAFFQQANVSRVPAPKAVSETLSILADHMDVVLDGLAQVEEGGKPFVLETVEYAMLPSAAAEAEEETEDHVEEKRTGALKALASTMSSVFKGKAQPAQAEDEDDEYAEDEDDDTTSSDKKSRAA